MFKKKVASQEKFFKPTSQQKTEYSKHGIFLIMMIQEENQEEQEETIKIPVFIFNNFYKIQTHQLHNSHKNKHYIMFSKFYIYLKLRKLAA